MTQVLRGKAIVNTRASHQASDFDLLIRERGAVPIAYPCIAIVPPDDTTELDAALKQLNAGGFDWLGLTSANTVYSLAQRLHKLDLMLTGKFKVAAVGPSTAEAAQAQADAAAATAVWSGVVAMPCPKEIVIELSFFHSFGSVGVATSGSSSGTRSSNPIR